MAWRGGELAHRKVPRGAECLYGGVRISTDKYGQLTCWRTKISNLGKPPTGMYASSSGLTSVHIRTSLYFSVLPVQLNVTTCRNFGKKNLFKT